MNNTDPFLTLVSTMSMVKIPPVKNQGEEKHIFLVGNIAFAYPQIVRNQYSMLRTREVIDYIKAHGIKSTVVRFNGEPLSKEETNQAFSNYWHNGFLSEYNMKLDIPPIRFHDYNVYNKGKYAVVTFIRSDGSRDKDTFGYNKKVSAVFIINKETNKIVCKIVTKSDKQHIEYDKDNDILYFTNTFNNTVTTYSINKDTVAVQHYHADKVIPVDSFVKKEYDKVNQWTYGSLCGTYLFKIKENGQVQDISFVTAVQGKVTKVHIGNRKLQPSLFKYFDLGYVLEYINALIINPTRFVFKFNFSELERYYAFHNVTMRKHNMIKHPSVVVRTRGMSQELLEYMKSDTKVVYPVITKSDFSIFALLDLKTNDAEYAVVKKGKLFPEFLPSLMKGKERKGPIASVAYVGEKNFYIIETIPIQAESSVRRHRISIFNKDTCKLIKASRGTPDRILPWNMANPTRYVSFINKDLIFHNTVDPETDSIIHKDADAVFKMLDVETMRTIKFTLKNFLYVAGNRYYLSGNQLLASLTSNDLKELRVYVKDGKVLIGQDLSYLNVIAEGNKFKPDINYSSAFAVFYYLSQNKVYQFFKPAPKNLFSGGFIPLVITDSPQVVLNFEELSRGTGKSKDECDRER